MSPKPRSFSKNSWRIAAGGVCAALLLAACTETRLAMFAAKKISPQPEIAKGHYKIGKPYQIKGVWYYPAVNYGYAETGIASWYGPTFHKKRTANGQIFDMNAITAAHRTLPLPSMVRVTNLKNGRSLKVLVNDRGPFARGRIIDLSRRSAQLLGFERAGTAPVRVEIIADESRQLALLAQGKARQVAAAAPAPVKVASLPRDQPVSAKTILFVQAGAFVRRDLALQTKKSLISIGPTHVVEANIGNRRFYRVRLGPVESISDGDRILDRVVENGYPNARLVVD
jgi:rare lipoprotein A